VSKCAIVIVALVVVSSQLHSCSKSSNPWTVVAVRERRPGEVPFEETSRYLRPSPDANNVPGPDSLVARVRTDKEFHPYIEIENLRNREAHLLLSAACLPQWSPDGKYISCDVWTPAQRMGKLTAVRVATRSVVLETEFASVSQSKWSPDSRAIVADGIRYGRQRAILYTVLVHQGKVAVLDTLEVFTGYEFSWSPDSHWIAFTRPTELDQQTENPVSADLWIADAESGEKWHILETPEWIEQNPLWITNHTILIDRVQWQGDEPGVEQRVVIELSNGT
jgi:hypothetical protein